LVLAIGLLVDDAIVVVENIHRRRLLSDAPLSEIIPEAVDEVGGPTILATLTVIAALLPMAFVTGLMGPYMSPIPINASIGMMISLAIAFIVTPWLAFKLSAKHMHHDAGHGKQDEFFRKRLTPFLRKNEGGKNRKLLLIGIFILIMLAVSLAAVKLVVLKMLPFDNKSEFQVVVDMPVGTPLEDTAKVLHEIGGYISTIPDVTDYEAYAGTPAPINFNGLVRQYYLRDGPEYGSIQVNLLDKHLRSRQSHEIASSVIAPIAQIAKKYGARTKIVEVPPGPPVLSPLVAEIYGPDYEGQIEVARRVKRAFQQTPDIVGIDDSIDADAEKVTLKVLQNKAALRGVAQKDIVEVMRLGLSGENVTPVHGMNAKYEIPVTVALPADRKGNLEDLLKLQVRSAGGELIPLSDLVQVVHVPRDKTIYHKDLLPVVYVVGDMTGKIDSPLYGMFDIRSRVKGMKLPEGGTLKEYFIHQPKDPYSSYALKWDGEWQVTYETFRDMGIAYGVGLILIYLLIVAQFRSYVVPLIIMAPIPLTIIGVMPGHALLGAQFTATSMIGMIALAGIIVRNSILLVDFINLQLEEEVGFQEAVIAAAATRAKPIVLTGLAAMIGAFFIIDDPIFNGLAISLIFGILVSTILTLVVIPVLYYALFYRKIETKE
ncbi:MAG TPA: efflux RND transporter permease subunit, partial [Burkholderiales bacterium]|nr:efflux RND transporter permease subunit [Burkholderiales bacterium]